MVELVQVEEEGSSLLFSPVLPQERDLMELRDQEGPEEGGVLLPDRPLGEPSKKDPPVVYHMPEVEGLLPGSHHAPH